MSIHFNYYWKTHENVLFQISVKSHHIWRILLLWGGGGGAQGSKGAPIHKFLSQLLLVNIWKCCNSNFITISLKLYNKWTCRSNLLDTVMCQTG